MKNNLELYSVVTGGYRRLQERSDDFSLQTDRHFIIIYIYHHGFEDIPEPPTPTTIAWL